MSEYEDSPGIEPGASRMLRGVIPLHHVPSGYVTFPLLIPQTKKPAYVVKRIRHCVPQSSCHSRMSRDSPQRRTANVRLVMWSVMIQIIVVMMDLQAPLA